MSKICESSTQSYFLGKPLTGMIFSHWRYLLAIVYRITVVGVGFFTGLSIDDCAEPHVLLVWLHTKS